MESSSFGGIKKHLQEHEELTRTVLWFGASSSCLAFMTSVAPQDGLTQHSCICPGPPCQQLQAHQQHKVTTTLLQPFDLREAIKPGYQNTMELVSEASEEGRLDALSFFGMLNMEDAARWSNGAGATRWSVVAGSARWRWSGAVSCSGEICMATATAAATGPAPLWEAVGEKGNKKLEEESCRTARPLAAPHSFK